MLVYILIDVAVVIAALIAFVATRPAGFRIVRSIGINAPPSAIFPHVNDFHKWTAWSPWENLDPDLKRTYSGPTSGAGATYGWLGNNMVGEGRMTIMESQQDDVIRIKLEFIKPFPATNTAEFTFRVEGNHTTVTWTMTGTKNFMMKAFGLFMDMDKMVGGDFEKGLTALKAVAEA